MWPRAATGPETGPGPRSSPMLMKTNSRALRHMHVSLFFFGLLIKPRAFLTSISLPQTSLTCWTTMRCPLECQRRSLQRSFRRTGSSLIPSWRPMWWRCIKRGDIYIEMKNVFNLRKGGFIVFSQPSLAVFGGREEHVNSPCFPFIKKNTIVSLSMTSVNLIITTKVSF